MTSFFNNFSVFASINCPILISFSFFVSYISSEAAKECKIILDIVESALPNGMLQKISEHSKLQEMFHKALELLPQLWIKAGSVSEAIIAYRRALVKPWNLEPQKLASVQKNLAVTLLYGGVEATLPPVWGPFAPKDNVEEAILLLLVLMEKVAHKDVEWDEEVMDHLSYALSVSGQYELLAKYVEQALPGIYNRAERWYFLALCYSAAGQNDAALNLLKKVSGYSEAKNKPHIPSFLLGAKLCSENLKHAHEGVAFASRMIKSTSEQNGDYVGQAYKFLGICYGNLARSSISDSDRVLFEKEALNYLSHASITSEKEDPEVIFNLGLEHAIQRNLDVAFEYAMKYSNTSAGNSVKSWKILALILSAEQRLKDAETIVDFSLEDAGEMDQLELLRLKAVLQIAREQPKQAIETYRILLALIQAQGQIHSKDLDETNNFSTEVRVP